MSVDNGMKKYFTIYKTLLKLNFATLVAYRSNFINSVVSSIAWGFFSIFNIMILTARTPSAFGWKREEILILTAAFNILVGLFHMIFSRNFERIAKLTNFGDLDRVLLFPIDSQFSVSFWEVNYAALFRIPIGFALLGFFLQRLDFTVSLLQFFMFGLLLLIGLMLQYSIWLLITTTTIWFTKLSNLIEVMYSVTGMARLPREMFRQLGDYIFVFLLPITLIIVTPVKTLFHKVNIFEILLLISVACFFFYTSRKFWKFALRYYTSASS